MVKSLDKFPSKSPSIFDPDRYGLDLRKQIAAESRYTGDVGIEIELEGRSLPASYGGPSVGAVTWVYHQDGSLRAPGGNAPGGAEYVLSQPCPVADVRPLVTNLFEYIRANRGRIVNSTRCSTHVHLNMRGVKLPQLASFVVLWGTFEDALANFCGGHRSGNHFALRMSDCHSSVDEWSSAFRTGVFRFSRERRYLALNPACLSTFGSLEVRTCGGVEGADEVVEWVEMLTALKTYALGLADPSGIGADLSAYGCRGFAERVFGAEIVAKLDEACRELGESFEDLVMSGFRRVQPLLYVLPWREVATECAKVYVPNPFGGEKKRARGLGGEIRFGRVDEGERIELEDD